MAEFGPRPTAVTRYVMPTRPWWNLDMYLRWEHVPVRDSHHEVSDGNVFLAMHFGFEHGSGAYIGLQQYGRNPNERYAIFSMWDHRDAPPDKVNRPYNSRTVDGRVVGDRVEDGGFGTRFLLPYRWKEGVEYRLRVWAVPVGWVGAITDMSTLDHTEIGTVEVPSFMEGVRGYGYLDRFANAFTEYFSSYAGCDKPYSRASWRGPYANNGTLVAKQAIANYPRPAESCPNTNVRGERRPVVYHETGGDVIRTHTSGTELW